MAKSSNKSLAIKINRHQTKKNEKVQILLLYSHYQTARGKKKKFLKIKLGLHHRKIRSAI
jgi:hypothetical protein